MTYMDPGTIGIFIAEEQELYRHIYPSVFETDCSFKLLGISSACERQTLNNIVTCDETFLLLIGTQKFNTGLFHELQFLCSNYSRISLVILVTTFDTSAVSLLRNLVQICRNGIAIYIKQSLDNTRQLHDLICLVSQGQVILDPTIASALVAEKADNAFMKELSDREVEILRLLSQGHTNQGIAQILFIESKTVAHHLNNIYNKLKADGEFNYKHPRVSIARLYMETSGELMPFNIKNSIPIYPSGK